MGNFFFLNPIKNYLKMLGLTTQPSSTSTKKPSQTTHLFPTLFFYLFFFLSIFFFFKPPWLISLLTQSMPWFSLSWPDSNHLSSPAQAYTQTHNSQVFSATKQTHTAYACTATTMGNVGTRSERSFEKWFVPSTT